MVAEFEMLVVFSSKLLEVLPMLLVKLSFVPPLPLGLRYLSR
jgi:hypothetical protein